MSTTAEDRPAAVPFPWRSIDGQKPRKRIWVPHVDSELRALWLRVDVATERATVERQSFGDGPAVARGQLPANEQRIVADGVRDLIGRAVRAAHRRDPVPSRLVNWWRGALVEQAYRNLHSARAQMVDLMTDEEVDAEVPGAVARIHATLHVDDPRRVTQHNLYALPLSDRRAWLRKLMEDGYEALDMQHARLRNFRNIVLSAAIVVILLTGAAVLYINANPSDVPLCFPAGDTVEAAAATGDDELLNCPTASAVPEPRPSDVLVVALLGLLGGTVAATLSIRKLGGSTGAYDVPVALAWLKVPLGAVTAILGIVAIRGQFVPGLTLLDSQDQILAYALLFGFAQQVLTSVLDKKAESLVDAMPTKESQAGGSASPSVLFVARPDEDGERPAERGGPAVASRPARRAGVAVRSTTPRPSPDR